MEIDVNKSNVFFMLAFEYNSPGHSVFVGEDASRWWIHEYLHMLAPNHGESLENTAESCRNRACDLLVECLANQSTELRRIQSDRTLASEVERGCVM